MKAIRIHDYGEPLVYETAPDPVCGAGQVMVRVFAAAVNPADWKITSGRVRKVVDYPMPLIPGGDIAGRIEAVGEGVEGFAVGDEVIGLLGLVGAYAEKIVDDPAKLARKPANLDFVEAASLPLAALTAWQAYEVAGGDYSGKRVLVHNGAGGVGSLAVQIGKAKGAYVLATASAANADHVRGLGADEVADFRVTGLGSFEGEVDLLIDMVGDESAEQLWPLVRKGGAVVRIAGGAGTPPEFEQDGRTIYKIMVKPNGGQLQEISDLAAAGQIRPQIEHILHISQADDAHRLSQTGRVRGKIVLKMDA